MVGQTLKRLFVLAGEHLSQSRILVVDIDPVIRSGICNFLATQGHIVSEASNCRDAQLQLQRFRPDVLVLDFYLPNGDAPQLLRQAKSMTPRVPVVALAGQAGSDLTERAIRHGADQVLMKPVELAGLHAALLQLLAREKSARIPAMASQTITREYLNPFVGSSVAIRRLARSLVESYPARAPFCCKAKPAQERACWPTGSTATARARSSLFLI